MDNVSEKISVVVVDDSTLVRSIIPKAIEKDSEITVVATATNGQEALDVLAKTAADVMVLDVEMPEMGGIEALEIITNQFPQTAVIMYSSRAEHGSSIVEQALLLGASDYLRKPSGLGDADPFDVVMEKLIFKIKAIAKKNRRLRASQSLLEKRQAQISKIKADRGEKDRQPAVIAIGASTGGPKAVSEVIAALPPNFSVPILIAMHMPKEFTPRLTELLNNKTNLDVCQAEEGMVIESGHIYIAPGDYHMLVARGGKGFILRLNQEEKENSCRPAIDVLFRSVADVFGPQCIACVLTGMGSDGKLGAEKIDQRGGYIIAQDAATSVVPSMPVAVSSAGLADSILPLDQIGLHLAKRTVKRA